MSSPTITAVLDELVEIVPAKVRTVLYAAALAVALLALAAQWAVGIWWPELDTRVDQTTAGVLAAALLVVGALGTAYRPTRATLEALPPAEDTHDGVYAQEALARTIATLTGAGYSHDAAVKAVMEGDLAKLNGRADA